ncbi:golgin subfamily B member 1-like isoform X3 [Scyliorhinus canicula]|uniref:golgin subfamily B member 1-like isoform X3 n=1 Tax=Scyliorhinus canicula TaxID=7830 RepID=UPI0018F55908|nr:golgin subfamily B member 1-like isoform X3 [Scyliorhinus canicula]
MDVGGQDLGGRFSDRDPTSLSHAASSSGGFREGELRRDLELLGAGGMESAFPAPTLGRQNMKHLSNEFQGLYQEKLRQLENTDECNGTLKMKLRILQSYVNDLCDQNEVLVQTVEDLEREANEKVINLDTKLRRADQILYEQQLKWKASKEETDHLRSENLDIKIDLRTLVGAIQQTEIMQKFDFYALNLRSIPLEQVAKPALHSLTTKKSEEILKPHLESLKSNLGAGDQIAQRFSEELKEVLCEDGQSNVELESEERMIQNLEEQQNKKTEAHGRTAQHEQNERYVDYKPLQQAQHKVQKKKATITDLKDQIKQLQQQYNETVEDNGRLRARLEAWMITAQSEQDILSNEVFCKEDIIHKLRMKQLAQEEKCNIAEEQIQHQEKLLEQQHLKYVASVNIVDKHQQMIHSLEQDLQTAMIAEREMSTQVAQCEETIKHLKIELSSLHSGQELNNRTIAHKKQNITELQQENESLNQKLKETLCKIHQKENKLCVLQKELVDAEMQYSACYEELLHREKLIQKLKEEAMKLTDQITQRSQDVSKLSTEKHEIELEMAVITEKHRTAQQEVMNRDQIILKIKTDLKMAQEKYTGSQEELGVQEAEINRLNDKLRDLQNEICKQRTIGNAQGDQLRQSEKSIQEFAHERELLLEELQCSEKNIARLHNDLDAAKQSHNVDLERWSQKNLLVQNELNSSITELQDTLARVQEYKTIIKQLKEDLEKAKQLHHESTNLVEQHEGTIKKQNGENLHLREQIDLLKDKITESHIQGKASEATADLYKQKYQTNTDRIQELEKLVRSFEEESTYLNNQIFELNETVHNLKDEMVNLQHRYEEKCCQMEACEEMIDQLSEELNARQEDLQNNKDHTAQCEQLIKILKDEAQKMKREIEEQEEIILQLQSDLIQYQINYRHSNEEYGAQTAHTEYLQKELEAVKNVCNENISKVGEYEQTIFDLRTEIAKSSDQRKNYALEVEKLEKTLQTLQLNAAASEHKHNLEVVHLQQQITQLENDFTDSQKVCNQKDQEIWKRDAALQKTEADLLQSQVNLKERESEVEDLDTIAKGLQVGMQELQNRMKQIDKENSALRTEIQQLNQELQDIQHQYREKAQELARREQKLILMESNLQATEKQLNDQIAEIVRQEQKQQKLHTEVETLKEHLDTTEEEMNNYKQIEEELRNELNMEKQQQQQNFQEILKHQHDNQKIELELTIAKDQAQTLQHQFQQQEDLVRYLRDELNQEQSQYQKQQRQLINLKYHTSELEAEVDNLKMKQKSEMQMIKDQEHHKSTLEEAIKQLQSKHQGVCDELMKEKSQAKDLQLKMTTAKNKTTSHAEEVQKYEERLTELSTQLNQALKNNKENIKDLVTKDEQLIMHEREMDGLNEKLQDNMKELEVQKEALEAVQRDNNQLHEENELMVLHVNKWITEQGIANETLGTKIKEQNQLVSHLTADKIHLQETIEVLSQELKKLRAELEEKKNDTEQIRALQSHSANQQVLLNQLRGLLQDQEHEQESHIAEKLATIEDMHNRLKSSIQSIQLLNQQLNTLSRENQKQKRELEKEQFCRHQLELQSETFGETIQSLRNQLKDQRHLDHLPNQQVPLPEKAVASDLVTLLHCSSVPKPQPVRVSQKERGVELAREDLEISQVTDPMLPDKSYWIQRVGELSAQLQESTEYWTDKMNELTKQIEHVTSCPSKK